MCRWLCQHTWRLRCKLSSTAAFISSRGGAAAVDARRASSRLPATSMLPCRPAAAAAAVSRSLMAPRRPHLPRASAASVEMGDPASRTCSTRGTRGVPSLLPISCEALQRRVCRRVFWRACVSVRRWPGSSCLCPRPSACHALQATWPAHNFVCFHSHAGAHAVTRFLRR